MANSYPDSLNSNAWNNLPTPLFPIHIYRVHKEALKGKYAYNICTTNIFLCNHFIYRVLYKLFKCRLSKNFLSQYIFYKLISYGNKLIVIVQFLKIQLYFKKYYKLP